MFLKMMSGEDLADRSVDKQYTLIECVGVHFKRSPDAPLAVAHFHGGECEEFTLEGNAYVLNNSGKTIDSFSFTQLG